MPGPGGPGGGPSGPGGRSPNGPNDTGGNVGQPVYQGPPRNTQDWDGKTSYGDGYYLGVGVGSDKFASKVQGRLSRKRFDDWMDRFAPKEEQLADRATSGEYLQQGLASADEAVESSFDSGRGQTERRLGRYG